MSWRYRISRQAILPAFMLGVLLACAALAEEPKIYKFVDEKGKVIYSNVPPSVGVKEKKAVPPPAYKGSGGYDRSFSAYDNPAIYYRDDQQHRYREAIQQRQKQIEDAQSRRLAELQEECNRQRRPDCSDPSVLRYIESTQIPRGYGR